MDRYFRIHNRYYRRDAFTAFLIRPGFDRVGGEVSFTPQGIYQEPIEDVPTGRWILRGQIGGNFIHLATLDTYDDLREYARREFELELMPEPDATEDAEEA